MTDSERIDHLEARLMGYGIALHLLMRDASAETKAEISRLAEGAADHGLAFEMTDLQIEQVQETLRLLGAA